MWLIYPSDPSLKQNKTYFPFASRHQLQIYSWLEVGFVVCFGIFCIIDALFEFSFLFSLF